jgi:hypothetical protein
MKNIPFLKVTAAVVLGGIMCSAQSASAQSTTLVGFEGSNPFQSPTTTTPPVTLRVAGDVGVTNETGFGAPPPQGTQYAGLTTFSNGFGTYPPGSPAFGGEGAVTAAALWSSMFPGSSNNQLTALNIVSGSAITFVLNLQVGNIITFNYRFLTSEPLSGGDPNRAPDRAFVGVRLGNSGDPSLFQTLSQPSAGMITADNSPFFDFMDPTTGLFSFTATANGTYTFGVGVGDGTTEDTQSGLAVDNFSVIPGAEHRFAARSRGSRRCRNGPPPFEGHALNAHEQQQF